MDTKVALCILSAVTVNWLFCAGTGALLYLASRDPRPIQVTPEIRCETPKVTVAPHVTVQPSQARDWPTHVEVRPQINVAPSPVELRPQINVAPSPVEFRPQITVPPANVEVHPPKVEVRLLGKEDGEEGQLLPIPKAVSGSAKR